MTLEKVEDMMKAMDLAGRLRFGSMEMTSEEREWLADFLREASQAAFAKLAGKKGAPPKHARRDFWLTMDYLVNKPSEKELQKRWNVRGRTKDIVRRYRKKSCDKQLAQNPNLRQWRYQIDETLRELAQKGSL